MSEPHAVGWTFDTFKEYLDAKVEGIDAKVEGNDKRYASVFNAQEKATVAALAAAEKATSKAEETAAKKAEAQNEWRAAMNDRERILMPRLEQEGLNRALADRIKALEDSRIQQAGQGAGTQAGWAWAVGAVGLILTVLAIVSAAIVLAQRLHS
jgi:hypothetical protein